MNKQNWLDTQYLDAENNLHTALLNMDAYSRAEPADDGTTTHLYFMDGTAGQKLNVPYADFGEALRSIGANVYVLNPPV